MTFCRLGFLTYKLCGIVILRASVKTFKWDVAELKLKLIVLLFIISAP